jgi:hypothetical protein
VKYQGVIKKSRTLDFAALLAIFGAIQVALPDLLNVWEIPARWAGLVTLLVSALVAWLRYKTTTAVGEK